MNVVERLAPDAFAILLFHGVIDRHEHKVRNYTRKHINADFFRTLLRELQSRGTAVSMDDVVRGDVPPNAFVVTFDDGFENNYSVAAPILADLRIPATFYVSTDFIANRNMSWIDKIEVAIEDATASTIQSPWDPGETMSIASTDDKIRTLARIRTVIKSRDDIDLEGAAKHVCDQLGVDPLAGERCALDRMMTWEQLQELARDPLFIVGGHSHHHCNLAFLAEPKMHEEIDTSLALLERHVGHMTHYCYPEGLAHCYSQAVIDHLKQKGIVAAPTAIDGMNTAQTDLFHLRRIMIVDGAR